MVEFRLRPLCPGSGSTGVKSGGNEGLSPGAGVLFQRTAALCEQECVNAAPPRVDGGGWRGLRPRLQLLLLLSGHL